MIHITLRRRYDVQQDVLRRVATTVTINLPRRDARRSMFHMPMSVVDVTRRSPTRYAQDAEEDGKI